MTHGFSVKNPKTMIKWRKLWTDVMFLAAPLLWVTHLSSLLYGSPFTSFTSLPHRSPISQETKEWGVFRCLEPRDSVWASMWLRAGSDSVVWWEMARILEPWKAEFRFWLFSLPACPSGFPGGASGKEPVCQCRRQHKRHGSERSLGGGLGNPFQDSCLENPMDSGAWWARSIGSQRAGHDWSDLGFPGGSDS